METISVDFGVRAGRIRPMHSVNNGPAESRVRSSAYFFREAGIPYARNHDAAFYSEYGGEHTVDITAVFPNFDADENDPASYDFHLTDEYSESICSVGTKVFYRLGQKIDHRSKKYDSLVPKDFGKWARICEHIVRHLNEGWNDGLHLGIEYWEIWNEPDLSEDRCWAGTEEQYAELYITVARHLKRCFPAIKVGGPAVTSLGKGGEGYCRRFFERLRGEEERVPLDFFSFHGYLPEPRLYVESVETARRLLEEFGYAEAETILDEWNYVRRWDDMRYSYAVMKNDKGAAYVAAVMLACQNSPLDHLMYYDARPCSFNGLFDRDTMDLLKPGYAMIMFNKLYALGSAAAATSSSEQIFACAAADGGKAAVMASYYGDDDAALTELPLRIEMKGLTSAGGVRAEYWLLDETHDFERVSEETFYGAEFAHILKIRPYTAVLVTLSAQ